MFSRGILDLPVEVLLMIKIHLSYPDLVFLRITHPQLYFSDAFNTNDDDGLRSRIEWLHSEMIPVFLSLVTDGPSPTLSFSARNARLWSVFDPPGHQWTADESIRFKTDAEFLADAGQILRLKLRHRDCKSAEPFKRCTGPHDMGRLLPRSNHIRRAPYFAAVRMTRAITRSYVSTKTILAQNLWPVRVPEEPKNEFHILLDRIWR